jgi:hypothetical protein
MAKLFEIDGTEGPILFEARRVPGEVSPVGRTEDVVEKISSSMGAVLGLVGDIARGFEQAVRDTPVESAELEFGLQFSAKGTIYVVETQGQGSIRIKLNVKPQPAGTSS